MTATLARAKAYDQARLRIVHDATGFEYGDVYAEVLTKDYAAVAYRMQQPHRAFACCSCESATQQNVCVHQVAVLIKLYPNEQTAAKIMFMLGTRFGFDGGCNAYEITALSAALAALCQGEVHTGSAEEFPVAMAAVTNSSVQRSAAAGANKRAERDFELEFDGCVKRIKAAVAAASNPLSAYDVALKGLHRTEVSLTHLAQAEEHQLPDLERLAGCTKKRHRSCLESSRASKKRVPATEVQVELTKLKDLRPVAKPSQTDMVTKCWANGRTASEAAQHIARITASQTALVDVTNTLPAAAIRAEPRRSAQSVEAPRTQPVSRSASQSAASTPTELQDASAQVQDVMQKYRQRGPCTAPFYAQELLKVLQTSEHKLYVHEYLLQSSARERALMPLAASFKTLLDQPA